MIAFKIQDLVQTLHRVYIYQTTVMLSSQIDLTPAVNGTNCDGVIVSAG